MDEGLGVVTDLGIIYVLVNAASLGTRNIPSKHQCCLLVPHDILPNDHVIWEPCGSLQTSVAIGLRK